MYQILKDMQDQSYPLPIKKTPLELNQGLKSEYKRKRYSISSLLEAGTQEEKEVINH